MEFLIMDIKGKFAHFRKFYTNSSSLTYSIPPRTTIEGIIAAILGYERDSYYEKLSADELSIAIKKVTKTQKIIQSVNYLKATSSGELLSPKDHTQIPFEILTGDNGVIYRVYIHIRNDDIFKELKRRLINREYYYSPYLGAAPFNCSLKYIGSYKGIERSDNDYVSISTILRKSNITDKGLQITENVNLMKEKMPRDFSEGRNIKETEDYIFEEDGRPLMVRLNRFYQIDNENISIM